MARRILDSLIFSKMDRPLDFVADRRVNAISTSYLPMLFWYNSTFNNTANTFTRLSSVWCVYAMRTWISLQSPINLDQTSDIIYPNHVQTVLNRYQNSIILAMSDIPNPGVEHPTLKQSPDCMGLREKTWHQTDVENSNVGTATAYLCRHRVALRPDRYFPILYHFDMELQAGV